MPKQKTHKGLECRVRVTKNKKVMRGKAGRGHLLSHKSAKRKQDLRSGGQMTGKMRKNAIVALNS